MGEGERARERGGRVEGRRGEESGGRRKRECEREGEGES